MFNDIKKVFESVIEIQKVGSFEFQLSSPAIFDNGDELLITLFKNEKNKWYLTDKKSVLKHMEELYNLSANDVKVCIKRVLEVYDFTMQNGAIICEIENESVATYKYFNFIMCVGQLIHMFAFFDEP